MRITFVARAIDKMAGGVERVIISVMNFLVERGHLINLITWDRSGARSFYPMSPEIVWKKLNIGDPSLKASHPIRLRRALTVRKWIGQWKPHIIVCFQDGPFIALRCYTAGMRVPIIAAERNAPDRFQYIRAGKKRNVIYYMFRFADRILVQFDSYKTLYPAFLQERITTIPNPVFRPQEFSQPDVPLPEGRFRVLSVGRLSYQKNYETLIESFAMVASKFPEWDLVILGEGERRGELERIIHSRNISDRVALPGSTDCITNWYASSHLFCLSSLWEGFPNALAEAMSHGLPVLGFRGCAGVRELIRPGENGLLANGNGNPVTLAKMLGELMGSAHLRKKLGKKAREIVNTYSADQIFSLWEKVLSDVAKR